MVHSAEMSADLEGEMRRVADFLEIEVPERLWPDLIEAAGFQTVKQRGADLMPQAVQLFEEGADRFFNKGQNGRWIGLFTPEDLAFYGRKLDEVLPQACIAWLAGGRRLAGEPQSSEP